jgi:hypothetical protein
MGSIPYGVNDIVSYGSPSKIYIAINDILIGSAAPDANPDWDIMVISGNSGTSGTSGTTGTSGTSGVGFDSILMPSDYRVITSTGSSTNQAFANTNLTYDNTGYSIGSLSGILSLNQSIQRINTYTLSGIVGSTVVGTFSNTIGVGGYFDYHVISSDGLSSRLGTVMAIWDANGNVGQTDNSTTDIGITTAPFVWTTSNVSNIISLIANPSSGEWVVKVSVRLIY